MKLITLEGIDGSGKTTIIQRLKEILPPDDYVFTREPYLEYTRKTLETKKLSPYTEALLYTYDRAIHWEDFLNKQQHFVICDRYKQSSYAYQTSKMVAYDWLQLANINYKDPDLMIYVMVPLDVAFMRLIKKNEDYDPEFLVDVAAMYEKIVREAKYEVLVVDGTRNMDEIIGIILRRLNLPPVS